MFSEIPKLFDKNFAIGYLIPSIGLLVGFQGLLAAFRFTSLPDSLTQQNAVAGSAVIVVVGWLLGIVLAATNYDIIRFLEGYGKFNPLQVFREWEVSNFRKLGQEIQELEKKGKKITEQESDLLDLLSQEKVTHFPHEEKFVLPTSFGNAIRAFEAYPLLMYGVDAIAVWPRLWTVIPAEYKAYIEGAKAQMDFWLNSGISIFILFLSALGMRIYDFYHGNHAVDLLFGLLQAFEIALLLLCRYRAERSAIGWGQTVKSAFDVYLPDLATKVGLKVPPAREDQYAMWENYGSAVLYAQKDWLPELAKPKEKTGEPGVEELLSQIVKHLSGK